MQLTIEWHPEEQSVGDVDHYCSQKIQSVHMSSWVSHVLQPVQVFGCGAHTDSHSPLEARAGQS